MTENKEREGMMEGKGTAEREDEVKGECRGEEEDGGMGGVKLHVQER